MNCREFESDLVELARRAPGGLEAAPGLRRHLDTCRVCAGRLESERTLTAGLRSLAERTDAPENLETERRVMEAFASARASSGAARPTRPATAWWMLAAAASAVLAVGSWAAVRWPHGDGSRTVATASHPPDAGVPSSDGPRTAAATTLAAESPASPIATTSLVAAGSPTRDRLVQPRVRNARLATGPASGTDELADFVVLPAADHLPGFDSGTIVRVALPTASLPAFGLPMTPDAGRTVDADVLVGQDGQARAIRLVSLISGSRREPR